MANIKVVSDRPLFDGIAITFKAPCECSAVDGLTVTYHNISRSFSFRDAHGNDLTNIGNLFEENAYVKAVLDTENGYAYLQNADTNAYIEGAFLKRTGGDMGGNAITGMPSFQSIHLMPDDTAASKAYTRKMGFVGCGATSDGVNLDTVGQGYVTVVPANPISINGVTYYSGHVLTFAPYEMPVKTQLFFETSGVAMFRVAWYRDNYGGWNQLSTTAAAIDE